MRILLVSHPPLSTELGSAQIALNLAAGLRARGHDACAWSPEPLAPEGRWWNRWQQQRRAIAQFAAAAGPFDVVDTPAISASRQLARTGRLVVRSIQPELRYLWSGVAASPGGPGGRPSPRVLAHALVAGRQAAAVLAGWQRAEAILCLGGHELAWMRRRFPGWRRKLGSYRCAPSAGERAAFAEVRRRRGTAPPCRAGVGVRFLWIGRWTAHKGTARLLRFLAVRAAAHPEDTFTLAGCGQDAERELPGEWLRDGRARVLPGFSRAELPALLAAHDAGLFTSTVEGWGLSLNEMLESGLPVYATPAGAVADLQPFFPASLRPFPPPVSGVIEPPAPEDLEANGYAAAFDWGAIARDYERQALAPARPRPPETPRSPGAGR